MADLTVRQAESVRLMIDSVRLVNRLQDYVLSADDGQTPDMPMAKITAGKILLDKSLPSLQSADITAHSSPETKTEDELLAVLRGILTQNPHLYKQLGILPAPYAVPETPAIEHIPEEGAGS